jgi:hypothetical protein
MTIDILTLCDNAQQYQGKLVIVGTFNVIKANNFPFRYPAMTFVARMGFNKEEGGNYKLNFSVNKEGEEKDIIPKLSANVDITNNNEFSYSNFVLNFNGITFPSAGTYDFKLHIDDQDFIYRLFVVQKEQNIQK